MKNKKITIGIIAILVVIAIIICAVIFIQKNDQKQAKQTLIDYMNLINEKNYEAMYEKVTNVNTIDKDTIIT